jgi:hypothetical protein
MSSAILQVSTLACRIGYSYPLRSSLTLTASHRAHSRARVTARVYLGIANHRQRRKKVRQTVWALPSRCHLDARSRGSTTLGTQSCGSSEIRVEVKRITFCLLSLLADSMFPPFWPSLALLALPRQLPREALQWHTRSWRTYCRRFLLSSKFLACRQPLRPRRGNMPQALNVSSLCHL